MTQACRLAIDPVWTLCSDGSVMDLADPDQAIVCFHEVAATLSKIARFGGRHRGMALSVAQHSVMGAQAIGNEGGTTREAALYLLHDAHEWALGDLTRPAARLYANVCVETYGEGRVMDSILNAKAAWDEAIYAAAGLPGPEAWSRREAGRVRDMDERMARAEAIALYGLGAAHQFAAGMQPPKTTGAIRPWGPAKAEEEFVALAYRLIGEDRIVTQSAIAAAARALRTV